MMYAYPFTLSRRAVLVTMDLSAKNLHMFKTDHWFSDPKNVILLRLDSPAWSTDSPVIPASTGRALATWTVEEVAAWLEGNDMVGPAAYFRSQGVNGQDLVNFESAPSLSRDLGTTNFVAQKVVALRDQYVESHA